jgi:coatomer subunit beta
MLMVMIIGEDALANLSIEKTEAGTITGHVRIRSKTQGIALSLGDRITMGKRIPETSLAKVYISLTNDHWRSTKG